MIDGDRFGEGSIQRPLLQRVDEALAGERETALQQHALATPLIGQQAKELLLSHYVLGLSRRACGRKLCRDAFACRLSCSRKKISCV